MGSLIWVQILKDELTSCDKKMKMKVSVFVDGAFMKAPHLACIHLKGVASQLAQHATLERSKNKLVRTTTGKKLACRENTDAI